MQQVREPVSQKCRIIEGAVPKYRLAGRRDEVLGIRGLDGNLDV